jgi:pyruvate carboxylase subunit B
MPGGAIGPNVHMMAKAGILERYSEVLAEFPVVVEAGGAWTSVTPGSQQYWLQAFDNVLYGRWKKIDPGYGKAVLGYFGRTPLPPDPEVVKIASEQLELEVFEGDPLEAAPKNVEPVTKELHARNLPATEENVFLVLAAMVPGKKMEVNEGIRLLTGNPKVDVPLKKPEAPAPGPQPLESPTRTAALTGPVTSRCTVEENGNKRTFVITLEPATSGGEAAAAAGSAPTPPAAAAPAPPAQGTPVYSTFTGAVDVVDIRVKVGDTVSKGSVLAQVEAMKATHDIKSPREGTVTAIHIQIGDEIDSSRPIMTIA